MRMATMSTIAYALMSLIACGSAGGPQATSLPKEAHTELASRSADTTARLSANESLENSSAYNDGGWLIFYWESAKKAVATLEVQSPTSVALVDLEISQGASVFVVGPGEKFFKKGHVTGQLHRECGPQGARCTDVIPTLDDEITYHCGPRGLVCRVKIPPVDD